MVSEKWSFHEQVAHNKRQTVWLFIFVFLILWGLVFAIGYVLGYPPYITGFLALVFGLVYLASASAFSTDAILRAARARPANPQVRAEKLLLHRVEEMSIAAGLPMPKVYVQESRDINAFATGKDPERGIIAVTQGALALLDQEELEGVIAHEMSHIKNYDIRVQTYAIALIGIIAMLGEMVWWHMFWGRGGRSRVDGRVQIVVLLLAVVFIILAPILSRLVYMAISRKREYLADATGAQLTRNPDGLARALAKIGGREPEDHHGGDRTVASLYFANPFRRVRRKSLFATHPPIEERIDRLRRM